MTLEEAIQQAINLGEKDPLEVARKVMKKYDSKWLAAELSALAEDVIAQIARQRLGTIRRSAEIALRPGDSRSQSELKIASAWVPGSGWVKAAELTVEDLRAKADWYDGLARASQRRAHWCREVADLMVSEKAVTLGDLKQELPALPGDLELAA